GRPVDELERQEVGAVDHAELEDGDDVGVRERDGELGFGDEEIDELVALRQLVADLFDDEHLLEAARPEELGAPYHRHAAFAEALLELVLAERDRVHRRQSVTRRRLVLLYARCASSSLRCGRSRPWPAARRRIAR